MSVTKAKCIGYLGTKTGIADPIFATLVQREQDLESKNFYDLFGGGGSMSSFFAEAGWNVLYNEFNNNIKSLFEYVVLDKLPDSFWTKPEWVSREKFKDVVTNQSKYDPWFVGYCQACWSFSGTQDSYMYGDLYEEYKKLVHDCYVYWENGEPQQEAVDAYNRLKEVIAGLTFFGESLPFESDLPLFRMTSLTEIKNWANQSLKVIVDIWNKHNPDNKFKTAQELNAFLKKNAKGSPEAQDFNILYTFVQSFGRLEWNSKLVSLEPLRGMTKNTTGQITFKWGSYDEVDIPDGSLVYCDPPYAKTASYASNSEGGFDHGKFWQWVRDKSKTCSVYVSEETAPDDFYSILDIPLARGLGSGKGDGTKKIAIEKLFVHESKLTEKDRQDLGL